MKNEKICGNCKYGDKEILYCMGIGCGKSHGKWKPKEDAEVVEDIERNCLTCDMVQPCNKYYCNFNNNFADWVLKPESKNDICQAEKQVGKFENIGRILGELVDDKQQAYGDAITAVEQLMKVLYPNGVKIEQYRDMLLMVRIMDKQCRIAKGDKTAFGESPFRDIAGYGLLGVGHGQ